MSTNVNNVNAQPKVSRRSSLRIRNPKSKPIATLNNKGKRSSISWGQIDTFEFKEMKPSFQESKDITKKDKEEEERHQKFIENRRKSIQNEFQSLKDMIKISKDFVEEMFGEEEKAFIEKNVKSGKDSLKQINESSESKSYSSKESDNKKNKKKNSPKSSKSSSSKSSSSSKTESDKESEKNDKKRKGENKKTKKIEMKKEKEQKLKANLKAKIKEYDDDKKNNKEIKKENNKIKSEVKNKEKENEEKKEKQVIELKVNKNVRLLSYKEARELDLDKVAYIVLTDGSVLVVRKEYGNLNKDLPSKKTENLQNKNYNNKSNDFSNSHLKKKNLQNYYNNKNLPLQNQKNNLSQYNQYNTIRQKIQGPNYKQLSYKNPIQKHQSFQYKYPKSIDNIDEHIYKNNTSFQNQKLKNNAPKSNNYNSNNYNNNNKYTSTSNSLWKENKNPQLLKYFSPNRISKPQYMSHNYCQSQNSLNIPNSPYKQFILIKSPQRQDEKNRFKVIEAIPYNYGDNFNSGNMDFSQKNSDLVDSFTCNDVIGPEINFPQNKLYRNQQRANFIYSPIKPNLQGHNKFILLENELNE